jgi:regulator of protease activity HflC (stomatin/prohibitin superfamily)
MSLRRWLGVIAVGLILVLTLGTSRPTGTSDLMYRLLWLAMLLGVVGMVAAVRHQIIHSVRTGQVGIIERAGRFYDTAGPGPVLVLPFVESLRTLELTEQSHLVHETRVLTAEGIPIGIKMLIRYRLRGPDRESVRLAAYEVSDWQEAVNKEAVATLHQSIGRTTIDQVLRTWSTFGHQIQATLQATADHWGVAIRAIHLFDVHMPDSIREALEDERKAEIEVRATEYRAAGEVERIRQISEVLGEAGGLDAVLTERYIQAMERMSANPSSHIVLPADFLRALRQLGAQVVREDRAAHQQPGPEPSAADGGVSQGSDLAAAADSQPLKPDGG